MPQYFGKLHTTEQPWSILGAVQAIEQDERHILFKCGEPCLRISVLAPNLIRVRMNPTGEFLPSRSWAVTQADAEWSTVPFQVREQAEAVEIVTEQLRIVVHRHPCRIECWDALGQPFAQDTDQAMGWRAGAVAGWKRIAADEHFYGFGERTGLLDQRLQVRTNWTFDAFDYDVLTDNMYQAIPFFMALRPGVGYGIFFNTTFWSQFDLGAQQPEVWRMETQGSELDYYIIYLPCGIWYDWWSGEAIEGPTHILAHAPLERMPLYVRAGAIMPMAPIRQYVDERPLDQLTLRIWKGTGEFTFYEDDGHTFEYKTGAFCTTTYHVRCHSEVRASAVATLGVSGQQTIVEIEARQGSWTLVAREILVELVGVGEQRFVDAGTARQLTF